MLTVTIDRPLVLASASPRRRELFGLLGLDFSPHVARIDETWAPGEAALAAVQRFAREKAVWVAGQVANNGCSIVIGADTIVVLEGQGLGKPRDATEAVSVLRQLRGREHEVYTAISIVVSPSMQTTDCVAHTEVPMRQYSDQEITLYVRSGDPFDKAGAYAIQHPTFQPVSNLAGCYANVMGLPLCHLTVLLRGLGIEPATDVPVACQRRLTYACPVYGAILAGECA